MPLINNKNIISISNIIEREKENIIMNKENEKQNMLHSKLYIKFK